MGTYLLRGITAALLVTVLTLFAGIAWGTLGLGGLSTSLLLDIGLLASCLVGGYRTAKESGRWWLGGVTGAGYVTVGTLLLALFLPIRGWGFIQVLAEGATIGLVAGAIGAGGAKGVVLGSRQGRRHQANYRPYYADYDPDDRCDDRSHDHGSNEFEWDTQESFQKERNPSTTIWMEKSEGEPQGTCGTKRDTEERSDVEWSWDRKDDKLIPLGLGDTGSLAVWEPEQVSSNSWRDNIFERNKAKSSSINIGENKESGTRPWWEE